MKLWWKRLIPAAAMGALVWLVGVELTSRATAQSAPSGKAGTAFKNVTTSTLKDLTVSDFLGSMGVMAAALGLDCADCHPGAGSDSVDWVFDTPRKKTARKMVEMVAVINKTNFGGTTDVTCWSCHHGRLRPASSIALDALYSTPNEERDDIVAVGQGVPSATQILDKYIAAVGGAQKLAGLTSFIATGRSVGYGELGGGGSFQILAKAPDSRAVIIEFKEHPERGNNYRTYNGKVGWVRSPRGLFPEFELTGSDLEGARLDALMSFPGQIKTVLNNWRSGAPDSLGDVDVDVVQGSGPKGLLATLYFDRKTGLLVRVVRFTPSPIGRVPIQMDYDDYRDVGGIKFPFKYKFSWLDGRDQFQLSDVKVNVPIDAAKFNKP
jgi:hypothetical protein